jgi:hypothetical protein
VNTMLGGALIIAFEFLWIGNAIRTLSKDLREFIHPWDKRDRIVLTLYWLTTIAIGLHLSWLGWALFIRPFWKMHQLHYF